MLLCIYISPQSILILLINLSTVVFFSIEMFKKIFCVLRPSHTMGYDKIRQLTGSLRKVLRPLADSRTIFGLSYHHF